MTGSAGTKENKNRKRRAPKPEGDGEWDVLCRLHDPVQAGALVELLEAEKIPTTTPGLQHRGMLGMLGAYVEIVVSVPRRDLARAKELLAALDAPADQPDGEAAAAPPRPDADARPRLRRVAAFVSLVIGFGTGHFYAGDRISGVVFLVAEAGAIVAALAGAPLVFWAVPAIVGLDFVGAQLALGERRAGRAPVALGRTCAILAAGAALLVPIVRATSPATLASPAGAMICEAVSPCGGEPPQICIEHLADRRIAGGLSDRGLEDCAACLEAVHACPELAGCATECAGSIALPRREPERPSGEDDFLRMLRELPGVDDDDVARTAPPN